MIDGSSALFAPGCRTYCGLKVNNSGISRVFSRLALDKLGSPAGVAELRDDEPEGGVSG